MKVVAVIQNAMKQFSGEKGYDKPMQPTTPPQVYLRAVPTTSGDGLAIEASLTEDFKNPERLVKVAAMAEGRLAVKRYSTANRIKSVTSAVAFGSKGGRILDIHTL